MKRARSRAFTNLGQPLHSKRSVRVVAFGVCFALLLASVSSLWSPTATANDVIPFAKVRAQQNGSPDRQDRRVAPLPPRTGPPAANLPNLDELRTSDANSPQARSVEPPRPVPSTMRSRRKARWITPERRLASDTTPRFAWPAETQVRAHHARAKSYAPRLVTSPQAPPPPDTRINYALASNGGAASVSSTLPPGSGGPGTYWSASALNNSDRKGTNWGYGGGWADVSSGSFPDWVQIDFNGSKTIDEIDLFTIQDNFPNPSEPTQTTTFNVYGVTSYEVQYWNGSSWVGIAGGMISGNNKVWRQVTFAAVTTSKIRVNISAAIDNGYSRMTEIEAWGSGTPSSVNVAAAANGATAMASSILNANFPANGVINGDRKGLNWGNGGGWADASSGTFPDWVQIDFNGSKTISEIDLFTLQNNYTNPADPTESMTFSTWGVSGYNVEYWNSETSGWTTVSGGSITGNNKVWRKISFSPITTTKIRVKTTAAVDNGYSRLTEIEAWSISANGSGNLSDFAMARLDPQNRTGTGGEDLLSNNFNWTVPLVSLPGRSGLDLGLALSYNSLVWTRAGNSIDFDIDDGSIAPGFRLGFPTIEGPYWNSSASANFYLLVTPSGARVELRQIGTSIVYESKDSSYLQLTDNLNGTMTLRPTDGSQMNFIVAGGAWRCNQVKDRNGNFINATYKSWGELETVTDTLGRAIRFVYDTNDDLSCITQGWNGQPAPTACNQSQPHTWATFGWGTATIGNNFPGLNNFGPNSTTIPVLTQVGLPDGSRYNFEYEPNSYGQVQTIRHYAHDSNNPNHERSQTKYVYSGDGTDCPRVSQRKDSAEHWTGFNGVPDEVVTQFGHDADGACRMTLPDGTVHKEYYAGSAGVPPSPAWQSGLSIETRSYATIADANSNAWQKRTTTAWTQDNAGVSYQLNPRPIEANVYDSGNNRRRTTVDYRTFTLPVSGASCSLPSDVYEWNAGGSAVLRRAHTDYNLDANYLNGRIIGLPDKKFLYEGMSTLGAKTTFVYDVGGEFLQDLPTAAIQHDAGYSTEFRGNLVKVRRWDVNYPNDASKVTESKVGYDIAGNVRFTRDALNHQTTISYTDSFSADGVNLDAPRPFLTFAYPTSVTDADGFSSTARYRYDFAAKTRIEGPPPQNQPNGIIQTFAYDNAARLQQVTTANNGAYTRYVYGPYWVQSFSTVNTIDDEAYAVTVFDGFGRAFGAVDNHPGSLGGYRLLNTIFDRMGRAVQRSNPTEINGSWVPVGDDAAGVVYSQQTYDWRGRPRITTNQDGTYKEASYGGCGCAGGEVVTLTDEVGRQQKVYSDVLGRQRKTEVLNENGTVYSATTNDLNARDQIKLVRQWAGAENGGGAYQDTTLAFDGYGRLQWKHVPEQNAGTATVYAYNSDDTIQAVTDARGASATYEYNNGRHLISHISYQPAGGVPDTPDVGFTYDAAGNRTSMTDGLGTHSYNYNQLSRMTSETRAITGVGNYTISYDYNLAGQLKSVTDPGEKTINYGFDNAGRVSAVTGSLFGGVTSYASDIQYRAWGALKHLDYGNARTMDVEYNARLQASSFSIPGLMTKSYTYHNDGRLSFSSNAADHRFDRSYAFDHAGRMTQALSGAEARGEPATNDRPYKETFEYEPLGHLTKRESNIWTWVSPYSIPTSFVNNRGSDSDYDADGPIVGTADATYSFDAAGNISTVATYEPQSNTTRSLDGNGQQVKTVESTYNESTQSWTTTTKYYIHSTVLGGKVLTELKESGAEHRTFVYAGSQVLATQELIGISTYQQVTWEHRDPSDASYRTTQVTGEVFDYRELDPTGADAAAPPILNEPNPPDDGTGSLLSYPSFSNPTRPGVGYSVDGIPVSWDYFRMVLDNNHHGSFSGGSARAPATRFIGYTVSAYNGRLNRYFGSNLNAASNEAIEQGHYTVDRNWLVDSNWSDWSFLIDPQTIPPNPLSIDEDAKVQSGLNRASELYGREDCRVFINALLQRAAAVFDRAAWGTSEKYVSTDGVYGGVDGAAALWAYHDALSKGRVFASGNSGRSANSITYGFTNPKQKYAVTWNKEFFNDLSSAEAGLHTLHESLHQFIGFNDQILANAARFISNETQRDYSNERDAIGEASRDFNRLLRRNCGRN